MFPDIESKRAAAGIDQKALCDRAGVHPTTYTARKNGRRTLSEQTINKLSEALDALIAERRAALDLVAGGE